jgi:hypothetical protein
MNTLNTNWIYTVPGSLVIAALLAWPMSRQDSENMFERVRFCLLTMLGGALLAWGFQQPPNGFHANMGFLTFDGHVMTVMAAMFLILLWVEKIVGMVTNSVFGCIDFPDDSQWDLAYETRQIEEAVQLFRSGKLHRASRLCNQIIESNSQYASTATTLAYWIENPGTLRFITPPRTTLKFKGRFSGFNGFWSL